MRLLARSIAAPNEGCGEKPERFFTELGAPGPGCAVKNPLGFSPPLVPLEIGDASESNQFSKWVWPIKTH
jgi:hypothetical protein